MYQLILAGLFLTEVLASAQPRLTPRVFLPGESPGSSFWLLAPDIDIVKIRRVELLGPEIEVTPKRLVVQLVGVDAEVENSLVGRLKEGPVRFYFFVTKPSVEGFNYRTSWFQPGARYVVFLREDGDVLRTMADVIQPNIRILAGRHVQIPMPRNAVAWSDVDRVIAYAALSPAPDYEESFALDLQRTVSAIQEFAAPGDVAQLLRNLLASPNDEIRDWACLVICIGFGASRDGCLTKLLTSEDPVVRQQAAIWAPLKLGGGTRLVNTLRDNPTALSISGKVEDLAGDLELFTFDPEPAVRQQACTTLRRLFPTRTFANCETPGRNQDHRP
jgi:hypothetical protein